jgi:hypothetical protein
MPPTEAALLLFLAHLDMAAAHAFEGPFAAAARSEHSHSALRATRSGWVLGHDAQIPIARWVWYPYSHGKLAAMRYVVFPT